MTGRALCARCGALFKTDAFHRCASQLPQEWLILAVRFPKIQAFLIWLDKVIREGGEVRTKAYGSLLQVWVKGTGTVTHLVLPGNSAEEKEMALKLIKAGVNKPRQCGAAWAPLEVQPSNQREVVQ